MKFLDKDWVPSDEEKVWAEKFLWPFVNLARYLTSWYLAWTWSFAIPYLMGQPLWSCAICAVISMALGWYIWRDYEGSTTRMKSDEDE